MRIIRIEEFLSCLSSTDVEITKVSGSRAQPVWDLSFRDRLKACRYWSTPWEADKLVSLVLALVGVMGSWKSCWVIKQRNLWAYDINDPWTIGYHYMGIPDGSNGALELTSDETSTLIALLCVQLAHGWSVADDLFVLTDRKEQILHTDHHGVVHLEFADRDTLNDAVVRMEASGFYLPNEPPDDGFQWQEWMTSR